MSDQLVRAISKDGFVKAVAVSTRDLTERARQIHHTLPVATAALGRTLAAASMMGNALKGDGASVTLQVKGGGPLGTILAVSDNEGNVRGTVDNPSVDIPLRSDGKLDVGAAVGCDGTLTVIRDLNMKEPYVGSCQLQTGEIAEDLTYYFVISEQVPSSVGLGVLMEKDNTVRQAGGFIIQLMPFTPDEVIDKLEQKLTSVTSVTAMLDAGMTPEEILEELLGEFGLEINEKKEISYQCDCSRQRIEKALISIGKKDIQEMIDDGKPIEVNCHFCNKNYEFRVEELKELLKRANR